MAGVRGVRFFDLFWRTLEPHRGQSYYPSLREKIAWLVQRKHETTDPASGRDALFRGNKNLAGIWHFAAQRSPDVVVFYTLDGGWLNLAMVGSHHDYPFNGKNLSSAPRTAERVRNAVSGAPSDHPGWPGEVKWSDPEDILRCPDLAEVSAAAIDGALAALLEEMQTGERYRSRWGVAVEDTSEAEFERYLESLAAARDLLMELRDRKPGARWWAERAARAGLAAATA